MYKVFRFLDQDLDGCVFFAVSIGLNLKEKAIKIHTVIINISNNTRFNYKIFAPHRAERGFTSSCR